MQFGVSIPHYGGPLSVDALRETVQRAESLGYHSAWVGDHVITPQHFLFFVFLFQESSTQKNLCSALPEMT